MILTGKETRLISYLWRHYQERSSINGLARLTEITPKGAYKILKKLERDDIMIKETIANADIYHLNFKNSKTEDIVKYVLKSEPAPHLYVKVLQKELEPLHQLTTALIIFGSVVAKGLQAQDIDLLIILNKKNLTRVQSGIRDIERIIPQKIHPVFQTKADMPKNLRKKDPVIIAAIQKGFILWGHDLLYKLIKNDAS